jgi:putative oxidoreductase
MISASLNIDLSNGAVLLRLICALFLLPHIWFKLVGNPPPALAFFEQAGFRPAASYMCLAIVVEIVPDLLIFC